MKDIENITVRELETIASGDGVEVPPSLESSIEELADSLEAIRKLKRSYREVQLKWTVAAASSAIVAGAGIAAALSGPGPKDTFDDPYLAYAEAEKALMMISEAMRSGASITDEAIASFERQEDLLEDLLRKK